MASPLSLSAPLRPLIPQRVHRERSAAIILDDLHHSGPAEAGQCLRVPMLAALLRDIQRIAHMVLYRIGELAQILAARSAPHTTGLEDGSSVIAGLIW